ncbi:hypothetical protein ACFL1G_08950 [Planctomycetota bacterium]
MKNVRRISKKYYLRQIVACFLIGYMLFGIPVQIANATPSGSDVVAGSAGVTQGGNTTTVDMLSDRAVINWDCLDTMQNEVLQFIKDGGSFAVLNRVLQGDGTQFDGSLFGNQGHILIVDRMGVIFGPDSFVQARKFTVSTLDVLDNSFMNGNYEFVVGNGVGSVENYGEILTDEGVALIAQRVLNAGIIRSPGGYVVLSAGDRVYLGEEGSDVVVEVSSVTVPENPSMEGMGDVINEGTIEAAGGKVVLASGDTFSRAIEGVDALSVSVESGTGRVGQFGTINVDGIDGDAGSITMTAADVVALGSDSVTTANAGANGDGGDVIVYSPDTALFREGAVIEAKGGSVSGDGGFAEVSGMEYVEVFGSVNASASNGKSGTFLIDPTDITIVGSGGSMDPGSGGIFTPSGNTSSVSDDAIEDFLDTGTNVVIDTTSSGTAYGDIIQNADAQIEKYAGGEATLTMNADRDIELNSGIESHAGALNVILDAKGEIRINGEIDLDYGGDITMTALGDITINDDVETYVSASSPVSVSITIDGDNVWVEDDVMATAIGNGDGDATATIMITAVGDVKVESEWSYPEAMVEAIAKDGVNNSATVAVKAGGNVEVTARNGGKAGIVAFADPVPKPKNENAVNTANVAIYNDGDVIVEATDGGEASIKAVTWDGYSNTSDVLICTEGNVEVFAGNYEMGCPPPEDSIAKIMAVAHNGYNNEAHVGIAAKGDEGVSVIAGHGGGVASIASKAFNPEQWEPAFSNTAETIVCTLGGVDVIDLCSGGGQRGGPASILAEAWNGTFNDAYVGVCAQDDVIVAAGVDLENMVLGMGGTAMIRAEAEASSPFFLTQLVDESGYEPELPTSANAEVAVISHNGGVAVVDVPFLGFGDTAEITAEAHNAYYNTADVGVAAGGNLLDCLPEYSEFYDLTGGLGLGVLVAGLGYDSKARIFAYAHDGPVNTADTVVCAPEIVAVIACPDEGGPGAPFAQIKSRAGAYGESMDYLATNNATTQVYAGDVFVYVPTIARGRGIWASAVDAGGSPHVDSSFLMSWDGVVNLTVDSDDDSATLIIKDYSEAEDCPDCPDCPCGELPLPPVPPLYAVEQESTGGCPALMQWLAGEIGVPAEQIQIYMANAFALANDMQPCQACARLHNASTILADEQGARIAALAQVINEFVTTPTPPSEEQMALIAASFSEHVGDGSYYADAGEWIDALAEYVGVMTTEMGFAAEDAAGFVAKYITPATETGDVSLTAFVEAHLAALGG